MVASGSVSMARSTISRSCAPSCRPRATCFRSQSDTEVIIYGYLAWGERVIDRLRGMFAFAIWDRAEKKLLLARDRFGKKPLYYARVGDLLLFGSEIKAILTWPQVERHAGLCRDRSVSDSAIRPGAAHGLCGVQQAAQCALPRGRAFARAAGWCTSRFNTGDRRLRAAAKTRATREDPRGRAGRTSYGSGQAADDFRRSARRVPVGRRGFVGHRRADGRSLGLGRSRRSRSDFPTRNTTKRAMRGWWPSVTEPTMRR